MKKYSKHRVHTIIQVGNLHDGPSRAYDFTLIGFILLTVVIAILETFPQMKEWFGVLKALEYISLGFFAIDYVLRIWTADELYPTKTPKRARLKYIFSWIGIVDLLSCIPLFIPMGAGMLRMFRIIRILRVFRVHHYTDPMRVIAEVLEKKKGQLLSSCFIVMILMMTASLLMYNLEHEAQPGAFSNAFSGLWWAVNTLLTVGYGDIVPITIAGKICGIVLTFLGVGMVAIPTGILSAGFIEQANELKRLEELEKSKHVITLQEAMVDSNQRVSYHYCPYCGMELPAEPKKEQQLQI
ncbi:MAG: ion transporter [Firmicutes bacterium]|nr:ion transporter [Bacillota bacterium]